MIHRLRSKPRPTDLQLRLQAEFEAAWRQRYHAARNRWLATQGRPLMPPLELGA